jgi:hypothetical protein
MSATQATVIAQLVDTMRALAGPHPQYERNASMRITRAFMAVVTVLLIIGYVSPSSFPGASAVAQTTTATSSPAVDPQYDTTHVYVAPTEFDRFVTSVVATFGGTASR